MNRPELLLLPNLVSLSRLALTPFVGYFLWKNDATSTVVCILLLAIAGLTDALDGYLARRMKLQSKLGLILDPLADKLFAAALIVELILFREFPVWLAGVIVGRDLLILLAGLVVVRKQKVALASTLTGKYTFFYIVILIGCSIIRFEAGVRIVAVCTLILVLASCVIYARLFYQTLTSKEIVPFVDRKSYQYLRLGLTAVVLGVCIWIYLAEQFGVVPNLPK